MEKRKTSATSTAIYSPTPMPVDQFVDGLRQLSEGVITKQKIYDYLVTYEIRAADLEHCEFGHHDGGGERGLFAEIIDGKRFAIHGGEDFLLDARPDDFGFLWWKLWRK